MEQEGAGEVGAEGEAEGGAEGGGLYPGPNHGGRRGSVLKPVGAELFDLRVIRPKHRG